ncbi:DUF1254 domain-containing protein [Amantichitinum ursilacus]|uniref:DUF1254 domain-containing protein n=1 Tax=Amantichitinum ursilacus TaxID=857265 RepID=UPI0009F914B9|nr:DUF1254 domain-containing protein [Amantichitinum ursilacus]
MRVIRPVLLPLVAALVLSTAPAHAASVDTPAGKIPLQQGLPADQATVDQLYDQLDYQRATQAYLWGLPIVGFNEWQKAHRNVFGAKDTDMLVYTSVQDKLGILTPNATTPYIVGFPDLARTGPLVIDYPQGASAGGVGDFWQRPVTDMGETGPDHGKGSKYLILGPGQTAPEGLDAATYRVVQVPTFNMIVAFRALDADPAKAKAVISRFNMYPYAQRAQPGHTRFLRPEGRAWSQVPPRGAAYWASLNEILQREPVQERDRFYMAMLKPLGIEKGKPFQPDARQQKILLQGATTGELMGQSIAFANRDPAARYRADTRWEYLINFDVGQDTGSYAPLDERTNYFYQAVTTSRGMSTHTPGVGQAYLGTAHDKDGAWLSGDKNYRLHVPPNAPAKLFWSLSVYDTDTRSFFANAPGDVVDKSSRANLAKNSDGSVDLYVGPKPPASGASNWIPTLPGKSFFVLFRLYAPLESYFDKSWKLPDLERVD